MAAARTREPAEVAAELVDVVQGVRMNVAVALAGVSEPVDMDALRERMESESRWFKADIARVEPGTLPRVFGWQFDRVAALSDELGSMLRGRWGKLADGSEYRFGAASPLQEASRLCDVLFPAMGQLAEALERPAIDVEGAFGALTLLRELTQDLVFDAMRARLRPNAASRKPRPAGWDALSLSEQQVRISRILMTLGWDAPNAAIAREVGVTRGRPGQWVWLEELRTQARKAGAPTYQQARETRTHAEIAQEGMRSCDAEDDR